MGFIMNEKDILLVSIKDYFTSKMLKISILPFFITTILMYIIFFYIAGVGVEHLGNSSQLQIESSQTTIENGIPHTETISTRFEGSAIIQFLMNYTITSWIATFLIYTVCSFFVIYTSIFIAIFIISLLTPYILQEIHKRYYKDIKVVGYANIILSLLYLIKSVFIMLILFVVLIPFYFIPLINVIAFNIPFYYFFDKMLTFDIASTICTREEHKQINYFNATNLRIKTFILYLTSLIPFFVFFGAVFYVIYLGHTYFLELRKLQK